MRFVPWSLAALFLLVACSSTRSALPERAPEIAGEAFIASDGHRLPLRAWLPEHKPRAVILAVHGFNDYSRFIEQPARYFKAQGIAVYAYDQRGFGADSERGRWAGTTAYVGDLIELAEQIYRRYPQTPLYVLGESMGGAVAIVAATQGLALYADGLILAAPAVWARQLMPWYQRSLLWLASRLVPWVKLSGDGLGILASDNLEMLRALSRDPLVIKATRIDALAGLADLMDQAMEAAPKLHLPTLYLYGAKDQVIPPDPTRRFLRLADSAAVKPVWYEQGYHLLLRDLHAKQYWRDILTWITDPNLPLPSGADRRAEASRQDTQLN
ncbi:alpha/beta hydrolase [Methylothermus subterraneus]